MADDYQSQDRSLLLEVELPPTKLTYLRLGEGSAADATDARGGDLVKKVVAAGPEHGLWKDKPRVFESDWRAGSNTAARVAASQAMVSATQTPAGWRDHTDGDRITTTAGDKIEVIGGNYKLVVLGHTGSGDKASGIDFSGGEYSDFHLHAGVVTEIRSQPKGSTNPYPVFAKTKNGAVHSVFTGTLTEEAYGEELRTVIGKPPAAAFGPNLSVQAQTVPAIYETITAKSITEDHRSDTSYKSEVGVLARFDKTIVKEQFREVIAATTHLLTDNSAVVVDVCAAVKVSLVVGATMQLQLGIAHKDIHIGPLVQLWATGEAEATKSDLWLRAKVTNMRLNHSVASLKRQHVGLQSALTALQDQRTAIEASCTALSTTLAGLESTHTSLETRVTALEVKVADAAAAAAAAASAPVLVAPP